MPIRKQPLVTGYYYHIYNHCINPLPLFYSDSDRDRFLLGMYYYQFSNHYYSLGKYHQLAHPLQKKYSELFPTKPQQVQVVSFCLMDNHYHCLLKQTLDNGIQMFASNLQNSYSHYFNTKHNRSGPIWRSRFHAKLIETDEQFLHVNRYIHLNPYSHSKVSSLKTLLHYPHSSLPIYTSVRSGILLDVRSRILHTSLLTNFYHSKTELQKFTLNQADYQRHLDQIKHLI